MKPWAKLLILVWLSLAQCTHLFLIQPRNLFMIYDRQQLGTKIPSKHPSTVAATPPPHTDRNADSSIWIPKWIDHISISCIDKKQLQDQAVRTAVAMIRLRLQEEGQHSQVDPSGTASTRMPSLSDSLFRQHVHEHFLDLCTTERGEQALENLFRYSYGPAKILLEGNGTNVSPCLDDQLLLPVTVYILQSLCIYGCQVGIKHELLTNENSLKRQKRYYEKNRYLAQLIKHRQRIHFLKQQLDLRAAQALLSHLAWRQSSEGSMNLLVQLGAWSKYENLQLLRQTGLPAGRFTIQEEKLLLQAIRENSGVDEDKDIRQDLTHLKVYTIDRPSTLDVDDGISIEPLGNDTHRLWIHIADVEHWTKTNSSLWNLARQRMTSHYLTNQTIPMFPNSIGSTSMSLTTGRTCRALSLGVQVNTTSGAVLFDRKEHPIRLTPSFINVTYRLSYDQVDEMVREGIADAEEWELGLLLHYAKLRRRYRKRKGSIETLVPRPIPVGRVYVKRQQGQYGAADTADDNFELSLTVQVGSLYKGRNSWVEQAEQSTNTKYITDSQILVSELMILAGEALGHWWHQEEEQELAASVRPNLLFRTQASLQITHPPDHAQLEYMWQHNAYGYAWYIRRFLSPVIVQTTPAPHAGLGVPVYVQWTSPIRRFGDLQMHSVLKEYLRRRHGSTNSSSSLQVKDCSRRMRHAKKLQDDVNYYWMLKYIQRQPADRIYDAVVLGQIPGMPSVMTLAIYVPELGLESKFMTTTASMNSMKTGMRLRLRVDYVDPPQSKLSWLAAV